MDCFLLELAFKDFKLNFSTAAAAGAQKNVTLVTLVLCTRKLYYIIVVSGNNIEFEKVNVANATHGENSVFAQNLRYISFFILFKNYQIAHQTLYQVPLLL